MVEASTSVEPPGAGAHQVASRAKLMAAELDDEHLYFIATPKTTPVIPGSCPSLHSVELQIQQISDTNKGGLARKVVTDRKKPCSNAASNPSFAMVCRESAGSLGSLRSPHRWRGIFAERPCQPEIFLPGFQEGQHIPQPPGPPSGTDKCVRGGFSHTFWQLERIFVLTTGLEHIFILTIVWDQCGMLSMCQLQQPFFARYRVASPCRWVSWETMDVRLNDALHVSASIFCSMHVKPVFLQFVCF